MPTFTHEILIKKPIDVVFAAVADVQTHPKWQEGLVRSESGHLDQTGVGATGTEIRKMFGREMGFPYRIPLYDPPHTWGFEAISGPIRPAASLHFSSQNGGTLIKSELTVPGFMGLLMGRMMLAQQKRNYLRLKELLESGAF